LILHSHQPVGQHPWVLERIYDESYLPMVEALEAHPAVRLSLHYTGCLLDWIKPNRPEFLERLEALVARGQVELTSPSLSRSRNQMRSLRLIALRTS
jgi:alpha-amylase